MELEYPLQMRESPGEEAEDIRAHSQQSDFASNTEEREHGLKIQNGMPPRDYLRR